MPKPGIFYRFSRLFLYDTAYIYPTFTMSVYEKYEIVMGLETHVRVKSHTKMFCSCANALELAPEPNIHVC